MKATVVQVSQTIYFPLVFYFEEIIYRAAD